MKILEIAFSLYPVSDMEKARRFYEGVLGLEAASEHQSEYGHWVEYEIGAGTLALGSGPGMEPSANGGSISLEVEDFDQAVAELREAGAPFYIGPIETPVCHMAYVGDPDGNAVGIHKRKPNHH